MMRKFVIVFAAVILGLFLFSSCQDVKLSTPEDSTPSASTTTGGSTSTGESSSEVYYSLTLDSSALLTDCGTLLTDLGMEVVKELYKDAYILDDKSIIVGVQSYTENETSHDLKVFSIEDSTYTKTHRVYTSSVVGNLGEAIVGGLDEDHLWMVHYGSGSLTLFYQYGDSTQTLNLEDKCNLSKYAYSYANMGKTLYLWENAEKLCEFQFKEDGFSSKSIEIAQNANNTNIIAIISRGSAGSFFAGVTGNSASVVKYSAYTKTGEFGIKDVQLKDLKQLDNGYLYALVSETYGATTYIVKINPDDMTQVSSRMVADSNYEPKYLIPFKDRVVVLLSKWKPFHNKYQEYFAVYDDDLNLVAPPTAFGSPYPNSGNFTLNPGYGVDSEGNLWFFLVEEDSVDNVRPAHILLTITRDGTILAHKPLDTVNHFKLVDDKGIVIEHDPYWGCEHLKIFTLNKSE